MIDLTISTEKPTSLQEILSAFRLAAKSHMAGVLRVTDEELVSADYNGSPYSAVIDAPACMELNPRVSNDTRPRLVERLRSLSADFLMYSFSKSWPGMIMNGAILIACWI